MQEVFQLPDNVRLNENKSVVEKLQMVMAANGGYCPCRLLHSPDNICVCAEFRKQIADPEFEGFCHCKLYYKSR